MHLVTKQENPNKLITDLTLPSSWGNNYQIYLYVNNLIKVITILNTGKSVPMHAVLDEGE